MESTARNLVFHPAEQGTGYIGPDLSQPPEERVREYLCMTKGQRISQKGIARHTGLSIRGVQGIIARLKRDRGLHVSQATPGHPSRYDFNPPVDKLSDSSASSNFVELRRSALRQTDYPKPQRAAPPATTSTSVPESPAQRNSQFHTTHRTYHVMGHGFNTHGRSRASKKHGQRWNITRELLNDDAMLQAVALDYASMGWIAAGQPGLAIVFEAAEHALASIGAKGRSKARSIGGLFIARVKDHRQRKFKPITNATEDRARLRLKRFLYGEAPAKEQT